MALVAVAAGAARLDAHHAVAGVAYGQDVSLVEGRKEARPARAAFELGLGAEERQAAEAAAVDAVLLVVQEAAAERGFGAVVQQDVGFFTREIRFQLCALGGCGRSEIETGGGDGWRGHDLQSKVAAVEAKALHVRLRARRAARRGPRPLERP